MYLDCIKWKRREHRWSHVRDFMTFTVKWSLIFHQPEHSHMTTHNCKGRWEPESCVFRNKKIHVWIISFCHGRYIPKFKGLGVCQWRVMGTTDKGSVASLFKRAAVTQLQWMMPGMKADQGWLNLLISREQLDISTDILKSLDLKILVMNLYKKEQEYKT